MSRRYTVVISTSCTVKVQESCIDVWRDDMISNVAKLLFFFFLIIRRPPRSTRMTPSFPTRRSSDRPDAGLWELRTRANVHTYSAVMGWAACDRLAHAARALGLEERETYWNDRAATMRRKILDNALRSESACLSAVFKGDRTSTRLNSSH